MLRRTNEFHDFIFSYLKEKKDTWWRTMHREYLSVRVQVCSAFVVFSLTHSGRPFDTRGHKLLMDAWRGVTVAGNYEVDARVLRWLTRTVEDKLSHKCRGPQQVFQ